MTTFISIFIVLWCVFGATLFINAMINWEPINKKHKYVIFFIMSGPLVWMIGGIYFIADWGYDSVYVRIRNWFLT